MLTAKQVHEINRLPYWYVQIILAAIQHSNSIHVSSDKLTPEQLEELKELGFGVFEVEHGIVVRWPC